MEPLQDTTSAPFAPKPFLIKLGLGLLILNLLVLFMATVSIRQSLRNHQERASATTQNLALVLDRFVADTLSKADLAIWAVKDEVELRVRPREDHGDLDAFIRRQHERTPGVLSLRTTDAKGLINHGSGPTAGIGVSLADREHFIRLRDAPDAGLMVSKPVVGRTSGKWVIILARRLEQPNHGFAGMVYAVIPLEQFSKAFSALDVGPHGSVALRDLDLGLIARYPQPAQVGTAIGQKVVSRELQAFVQSGKEAGVYQARTPFDQVQRSFSIRRVSGLPFYLVVGLADQDYLKGWRREVFQACVEVALFICLTLVASWLIHRAWSRQQAAHTDLERLFAEVKTLGGMLPICGHCKKVRDDKGYWNQIEAYLNEHTDAEFTHGICPDCALEVFPRQSGKHRTL